MLLSNRQMIMLVAEALQGDILPELTAPNARSFAQMSVDALRELMKREDLLPGQMRRLAQPGLALADELEALGFPVDHAALAPLRARIERDEAPDEHAFNRLIAILDEGASAILAARDRLSGPRSAAATEWLGRVSAWDRDWFTSFDKAPLPELAARSSDVQLLTLDKLERHLRDRLADPELTVHDMRAIPGGMLNEIFFCTLRSPGRGDREVVVRKNVAQPLFAHGAHRVAEEFVILKGIHRQGLPVPEPLWLFCDLPDVDGNFYVQSRGYGDMVGGLMGAHQKLSERLLFSLADFLARLHAIPSDAFTDYLASPDCTAHAGETVRQAVTRHVDHYVALWLASARKPSPSEAFALDWLQRNIPENANPAVMLHTDCFVHNFLVEDDQISCVLDWECAHFGDPAEDLAYIRAYVSEHMPWDRFVERYRASGGQPIVDEHIDYYTALLHFRNFWGCNIGAGRADRGFSDVRLIPLGSEHRTRYMGLCLDAIAAAGRR